MDWHDYRVVDVVFGGAPRCCTETWGGGCCRSKGVTTKEE